MSESACSHTQQMWGDCLRGTFSYKLEILLIMLVSNEGYTFLPTAGEMSALGAFGQITTLKSQKEYQVKQDNWTNTYSFHILFITHLFHFLLYLCIYTSIKEKVTQYSKIHYCPLPRSALCPAEAPGYQLSPSLFSRGLGVWGGGYWHPGPPEKNDATCRQL